mgnify:CR=1 FL=1
MAFKMNKKNVSFGEGTGSSPKKFGGMIGAMGGMFGGGGVLGGSRLPKGLLDKQYKKMSEKYGEEKAGKHMKTMYGYEPTPTAGAQGTIVGDPGTQDAGDFIGNLEAKKAAKGGGGVFGGIGKAVRGDGSLKDRLRSILQELENKE